MEEFISILISRAAFSPVLNTQTFRRVRHKEDHRSSRASAFARTFYRICQGFPARLYGSFKILISNRMLLTFLYPIKYIVPLTVYITKVLFIITWALEYVS